MAMHFSFAPNRELPFVFGDLFRISSKLSHYRLGGIQQIASVIGGQYLEKKEIHEESQQSEWFEEKERLSERESSTMESTHEGMQQSLAETVAKSQKFSGSLEAEGKFGVVRVAASLAYDNDQSKSQSKTSATEFARDVVTQSRELMRERTLSSRRQSINVLDRTENVRGFDNRGGASSTFISRYVEEVHEFSLVQEEKRLFTTFVAPFPAANYLNALEAGAATAKVGGDDPGTLSYLEPGTTTPVKLKPEEISLDPASSKYWFKLASIIGLVEPTPPPEPMGEAFAIVVDKNDFKVGNWAQQTGSVRIPEGYRAEGVTFRADVHASEWGMSFVSAKCAPVLKWWGPGDLTSLQEIDIPLDEELVSGELPYIVTIGGIERASISGCFRFTATPPHIDQWKLRFFEELRNAKAGKGSADEILSSVATVQVADLRSSPTAVKEMIQGEMELLSLRVITGYGFGDFKAVDRRPEDFPEYPVLDIEKINDLQPINSFLHHGIDFAKMSFDFLPSRFGGFDERRSAFGSADAGMLSRFLTAGAAEIVLPVKSGFEEHLFFFLYFGFLFDGRDVPLPDDPIVLALYDEILEARALNQSPDSITIDTWQEPVPTSYILLQNGATLPDFRPGAPPDPGGVAGNALAPKPA
jgi:hypothetical protein